MFRSNRLRTGVEILGSEDDALVPATPYLLNHLPTGCYVSGANVVNPYLSVLAIWNPGRTTQIGQLIIAPPVTVAGYDMQDLHHNFIPEHDYWKFTSGSAFPVGGFDVVPCAWGTVLTVLKDGTWITDPFKAFPTTDSANPGTATWFEVRTGIGSNLKTIGAAAVVNNDIAAWFAKSTELVGSLLPPGSDGSWLFRTVGAKPLLMNRSFIAN